MAAWIDRLQARAALPPVSARVGLHLATLGARVGSVEAVLAQRMIDAGLPLQCRDDGVYLVGPASAGLATLAGWLQAQGLGGRWRDELLAVTDTDNDHADAEPLAAIERAAVRPLGITTHAVHLSARRADGSVWVQRRALDKATDPGLWDTTMGGLRAAGETVHDTLTRETWEEAGLRLAQLQALQAHGRLTVRRPLPDGYMVEHIDTFSGLLPEGSIPFNQDGEVQCFECLPARELRRRLQQDSFTLEAALVLLQCLPELR